MALFPFRGYGTINGIIYQLWYTGRRDEISDYGTIMVSSTFMGTFWLKSFPFIMFL